MDPARPTAEAVAVQGDRVRAVGSMEELNVYGNARIDKTFSESVLFPGFVEAHTHLYSGGLWAYPYVGFYPRMSPDGRTWAGCRSVEAVVERLKAAESQLASSSEPLTAWGLDPIYFAGERLDRRHLDTVSSCRPIVVVHQSGHLMTVNSVALDENGITRDIHVDGVVKDLDGEPTGELREPVAMSLIRSGADLDSLGFTEEAAWNFAADARNHGITTLVDLGSRVLMDDEAVAEMHAVVNDPDYPARLSVFHMGAGVGPAAAPEVAAKRLLELRDHSTSKLRFGHVKLILDGSIQGFTARLLSPGYLPDDRKGIWLIPPETFAETIQTFHEAGLTIHVHCNGDEATELFIESVERALAHHPRWDHRHTVTHSQLTTPAQYKRMAALGMCANIFSNHIWYWGDQHRDLILGPDRASRMDGAATALRCGVPIALHCDTPVTPLDALATASYAVSRSTASGEMLGEHERITIPQALHAMTLGAAYMLKMDHEVGSIEAGKYADFAVLDRDPLCADDAGDLRDIHIHGTVLGGRHFPVNSQDT
jgi:predicted amidohydrolase YtcJ